MKPLLIASAVIIFFICSLTTGYVSARVDNVDRKFKEGDIKVFQVSATWCPPCRSLKRKLKDQNIIDSIKKHTKGWLIIDVDLNPSKSQLEWISHAGITSYPTVIKCKMTNGTWVEINRFTGDQTQDFLLKWLKPPAPKAKWL